MISKKVGIAPQNDNYAKLAAYIADAGPSGEKNLMHWSAGCLGDDDYHNGIAEVQDVQALNRRTKQCKTYHLVISFRPEDEASLTPELFMTIERRFAAALGYEEHQRHCGVHKNTGNLHMHIAYNMIHPEKHTWHKEFRDFRIRDALCRELEQEFGLAVDRGKQPEQKTRSEALSQTAAMLEAHTGQQSFESYAKSHKANILQALESATDWQALHEAFAGYGMALVPHGNGLAVEDAHSKAAMKASALDRSLSLKKLKSRLGPFVRAQNVEAMQEHSRYRAEPLHRSPERGQLFALFQQAIETRKEKLQTIKEQEATTLAAIRLQWEAKRQEIERMNIAKRNRRNLLALARKHEAEALAKARLAMQPERESVQQELPFSSWSGFLQHQAEQGNEVALSVLRSRQEEAPPERTISQSKPTKDWSQHGLEYASAKAQLASQQRAALENTNLTASGKKQLLAVLRMEELVVEENSRTQRAGEPLLFAGVTHRVDRKGTVVFTLHNGATVRDTGKEVLFSAQDATAQEVARRYATKKWGKSLVLEGNKLCRKEEPKKERLQTRCLP
jgi:hypothetical protein